MKIAVFALGILFGFALTRVGASEYDMIHNMFTGRDLTLAGVMVVAIIVGLLGMRFLGLLGNRTIAGQAIRISRKPLTRVGLFGAALFGAGWGLSGACPGTVLAQVGSGRTLGLFTMLGMLLGTYIYALWMQRVS